jgi:biopolymer transport protein ExbB
VYSNIYESMMEHLETGGWVMIPLIVVSLFMVLLIAMKILEMRSFTKGDISADHCATSAGKPGFSAAFWQLEIINGFLKRRTFDEDLDRNILDSLRIRQERFAKRYIGTIAILAAIAPLLGLLGTVGGMIKTFTVIAMFGTGNAKALASGISEALITTQTGLVVAIPGLFLASYLHRKSDKLVARMQRFCLGLLKLHRNID